YAWVVFPPPLAFANTAPTPDPENHVARACALARLRDCSARPRTYIVEDLMKRVVLVVLAIGCSAEHHSAGPDAAVDVAPDTGFAPAPHTALPVVLPHNHTVLKN